MSHVVLGPQGEPIFCRSAEEARGLEASASKRMAEPAVTLEEHCPTCGRLIDDEEEASDDSRQ
jgi:hypothetical protein